jgi:hypothetical protein
VTKWRSEFSNAASRNNIRHDRNLFWLGTWRYESAATSNNTWPLVAERKPPNGESSISGRRIGMIGDLIPKTDFWSVFEAKWTRRKSAGPAVEARGIFLQPA